MNARTKADQAVVRALLCGACYITLHSFGDSLTAGAHAMEFAFYFDGTRCTGCKTCMMACKDYYGLPSSIAYRQVYEYELHGEWKCDDLGCWTPGGATYYVSISCQHCANPACMHVCPTGAMHKEQNGIVRVDDMRCIGCGYCHLACPYNAPKVDEVAGHSVKCTGCYERVEQGLPPVCVAACPQRALGFGDFASLVESFGDCRCVAPLPPQTATNPHLVIRPPRHAVEPGTGLGFVANRNEVV